MSKEKNTDEVYAAESDAATEEVPASHDPETFDVAGMVHGVRATRMRVKIQPNGHLLERLQEIADEIDALPADQDVPDDLQDEWWDIKDRYDHVDVYVVEGRTSDWVRHFVKKAKADGIDPTEKGLPEDEVYEKAAQLKLAQIAAQIVTFPEGKGIDDVAQIFEGNEAEGNKLFRAVEQVNKQPAGMVTPDFSARVSRLSRRG